MKITPLIGVGLLCGAVCGGANTPSVETWLFDNLTRIGGHAATVFGHPEVIATPRGKAIRFNGVDDAVFLDAHPLAGAETYTWELIFRPDPGGAPAQRFFHMQETGSDDRMMFELRVIGDQWCLDSFVNSGTNSRALLDNTKLHSLGEWYSIATVYDGHELRNYVDGVLQGSGELHATPQKPGQTSIGTRFNKRDYFKGAVREARMTPRALTPAEFLRK
jgi:hypothetical protein